MYRDLGMLKRDIMLQKRYNSWAVDIKAEYGSIGESFVVIHTSILNSYDSNLSHELPPAMGETR